MQNAECRMQNGSSRDRTCPRCGSEHTRRGGNRVWGVYLVLIGLAVPAVVAFHLNAGIVAAILLVMVLLAHIVFDERVCVDCGNQWRR
jgi:ribosomal protein S27AE